MKKKLLVLYLFIWSVAAKTADIPLLGAAKLASGKLTQQLLCAGNHPNIIDELGNTPLHYAVHKQSKEVSRALLSHAANPNIKNAKGKTALHIAAQVDDAYLIRLLLRSGADPNMQDAHGETPLHIVARNAHRLHAPQIIQDLLLAHARKDIKNNRSEFPIDLAHRANATQKLFKRSQNVRIAHVIDQLQSEQQPIAYKPKMSWPQKWALKRKSSHLSV